jgi:hypothetical protein
MAAVDMAAVDMAAINVVPVESASPSGSDHA